MREQETVEWESEPQKSVSTPLLFQVLLKLYKIFKPMMFNSVIVADVL